MATYDYTIITDSATDMPKWVIDKYNLRVIPTPVVIDGKDYFDGATVQPAEFYDILRKGTNVTTYHINEYMFEENFEPYAKENKEILYLCFSTGIAGTFGAANLARTTLLEKYPDFKCHIMDSKCAAIGFGLCAYIALLMQEKGASLEEVMEATRWHFDHCEHIFTVETLEYLYKGGRLSRGAAIAGGILDIKPIIEVTDDGKLEVVEKVRGREKSLKRMYEMIGERSKADLSKNIVGVVHADCSNMLPIIEDEITKRYGVKTYLEGFLGCAIGAHTGPGLVGICFLDQTSPWQKYFEQ